MFVCVCVCVMTGLFVVRVYSLQISPRGTNRDFEWKIQGFQQRYILEAPCRAWNKKVSPLMSEDTIA